MCVVVSAGGVVALRVRVVWRTGRECLQSYWVVGLGCVRVAAASQEWTNRRPRTERFPTF